MRFSFPVVAFLSLAVIGLLAGGLWWMSRTPGGPSAGPPLRIYCAAGLRLPVEAIAKEYEAAYGTQVQTVFGGSGALVADIRAAGGGDLFIAADRQYILEKGRVAWEGASAELMRDDSLRQRYLCLGDQPA